MRRVEYSEHVTDLVFQPIQGVNTVHSTEFDGEHLWTRANEDLIGLNQSPVEVFSRHDQHAEA